MIVGLKARQIPTIDAKAIATDFLTSDELSAYNKAEERLTVLLDMGLTYDQIKTLLLVQTSKRLAG